MSCKKGGFINIRQNDVKDFTVKLLSEVGHHVQVEPTLLPLTGERWNIVLLLKLTRQGWTCDLEDSGCEDSRYF